MTCSYEEITFWDSTVRIVVVDAAFKSEQEKSVLDCWRMYLLSRIVRGMFLGVGELRVIGESIWRDVGRQLHGAPS
jgi:hypothetical protein